MKALIREYSFALIKEAEGFKENEYLCPAGKRTIGFGKRVDYLSDKEKEKCSLNGLGKLRMPYDLGVTLLLEDIDEIYKNIEEKKFMKNLSCERIAVIIDMVYNMGLQGFLQFKKTISYIEKEKFKEAGEEMLNSKWAKMVGNRAIRNSNIFINNFINY